jgi:hypothetical protein
MSRRKSNVREASRVFVRDKSGTHEVDFANNNRTTVIRKGLSHADWYAIGLRIGLSRAKPKHRRPPVEKDSNIAVIANRSLAGVLVPIKGAVA